MPKTRAAAGRLMLVDGHSVAFRAYYALPDSIRDVTDQPANALYGFMNILFRVLTDQQPTHLVVTFDLGMLAGIPDSMLLAVALSIITTWVLATRTVTHRYVEALSETDLLDTLKMGIIALVIYPLLPETPLAESALLVNASGEPSLASELGRELATADRVDLLCAFVKWSGLRVLIDALAAVVERGWARGEASPVRVLTTTYIGASEVRALDELARIGAEVRISYDDRRTRLHAKAWLFHRRIEPQLEGTLPSGIAWTALPTLSYNPVYGLAFGASLAGGGTTICNTTYKSPGVLPGMPWPLTVMAISGWPKCAAMALAPFAMISPRPWRRAIILTASVMP